MTNNFDRGIPTEKNFDGSMPREKRAKQFAPFAALKGYEEELYVQEQILTYENRRELSEDMAQDINEKLNRLQVGERVEVTHYHGCRYIKTKGHLTQIDPQKGFIKVDGRMIRFVDMYGIAI